MNVTYEPTFLSWIAIAGLAVVVVLVLGSKSANWERLRTFLAFSLLAGLIAWGVANVSAPGVGFYGVAGPHFERWHGMPRTWLGVAAVACAVLFLLGRNGGHKCWFRKLLVIALIGGFITWSVFALVVRRSEHTSVRIEQFGEIHSPWHVVASHEPPKERVSSRKSRTAERTKPAVKASRSSTSPTAATSSRVVGAAKRTPLVWTASSRMLHVNQQDAISDALGVVQDQLAMAFRQINGHFQWTPALQELVQKEVVAKQEVSSEQPGEPLPEGTTMYSARLDLTLTPNSLTKIVRQLQLQEAGQRQWLVVKGLIGAFVLLTATAGYCRARETIRRHQGSWSVALLIAGLVAGAALLVL